MHTGQPLRAEEASRLAITATVADLKDWGRSVAVDGHIDLDDLVGILAILRSACLPPQRAAPTLTTLSSN